MAAAESGGPERTVTRGRAVGTSAGDPTVVVSHLDITYRVLGVAGRSSSAADEDNWLKRTLRQGRDITKVREVPAVKDVSFVAHHGESIGIIGRNGSGKSTLLRAVAGLIPPTEGRVWVAGEPALLGVNAVLMSKLTGERNIYLGAQAMGLTKAQIAERFDDIVEFSGIGDAVYMPMSTYSSGMAARLRFAISTAAAPDVLMVDEALATGDADFRAKSSAKISQIREQAATVFLVSHSNSTIRSICDRALWMDRGVLVADGPAEEVVAAYEKTLPKRGGSASGPTARKAPVKGTKAGRPSKDAPTGWPRMARLPVKSVPTFDAMTGNRPSTSAKATPDAK
ncbi:ABC transporter ATP-binding protein [Janibacter sp. G1551]|uniref:ABC transporter ATP-binding protein n=1 Tax=Janibacter sp. G1551 TaxID=3420440 RepID=UPI003D08AB99